MDYYLLCFNNFLSFPPQEMLDMKIITHSMRARMDVMETQPKYAFELTGTKNLEKTAIFINAKFKNYSVSFERLFLIHKSFSYILQCW